MKTLKVGETYYLGKGYDFHRQTMTALQKTEELIKANKDVINTIFTGITVSANANNSNQGQNNL